MAWELRNRRGPYYTRSRRVNGRVVREYFGRGAFAEEAFREDLERREAAERDRADWSRKAASLGRMDANTADFDCAAAFLLRATLYAMGYHLHKRGEWRRWREGTEKNAGGRDEADVRG
jgi:hypothetical protein